MSLIKFRSWINEDIGQPTSTTPANPADMMRQLHQQLSNPATTPEAKKGIMAQLDQIRKGPQANPAQQPQNAPQANSAHPTNNTQTPQAPAYRWQNGKPVPVGQV